MEQKNEAKRKMKLRKKVGMSAKWAAGWERSVQHIDYSVNSFDLPSSKNVFCQYTPHATQQVHNMFLSC